VKKITLLSIVLIALTGCLEEGIDGCPSYLRLTFLHDNSAEEFDRIIGNDIHLMIYKDDVLESIRIIPYEEIADGREHRIRKTVSGTIDVVAWASPVSDPNVEPLPEYSVWDKKSSAVLQAKPATRAREYLSMGSIYLGVETFQDNDITREVVCPVSLINCISKVTVSVFSDEGFGGENAEENMRIELSGSKNGMDLNFQPIGEDAMISASLEYNDVKGCFESGQQGLLPSADDQYLTVHGYRGETLSFIVRTDLQARPGSVFNIEIYRKTVMIEVDGWRIYDAVVEWL